MIKNNTQIFTQYLIACILSLCIFIIVTHAWQLSLSIPYNYYNDSVFTGALIKSVIDTGWFLSNIHLGAPSGYNMANFPLAENFHFLIIKLFSLFTNNYAVILNVFYILTFPGITLVTLFVLRRLEISYPLALTASLLFAFLPYHFEHGQAHLFLSSYYDVPLIILLAVTDLVENEENLSRNRCIAKWGVRLLICVLIGSSGIYYAFFGAFYLIVSGTLESLKKHHWKPFQKAVLLCGLISITMLVNISPLFFDGSHPEPTKRYPHESEVYSYKITPLLLPVDGHRIRAFAKLRHKYQKTSQSNGGLTGSLGIIGDIGFLILLGVAILGRNTLTCLQNLSEQFYQIARLNLCGVLFATMGGFGALFAYTVSPMIRCYDRMSIFTGFFALYAFFYLFQLFWDKKAGTRPSIALWIISILFLFFGIFDQTVSSQITNGIKVTPATLAENTININAFQKFISQIENSAPKNSSIFQLPYISFPEVDYDLLKPYLYSRHLNWSFGSMRGNAVDQWQMKTSRLPVHDMICEITKAGFVGIYIDRTKYKTDHGKEIEKTLTRLTGKPPLESIDKNQSYFSLQNYGHCSHWKINQPG